MTNRFEKAQAAVRNGWLAYLGLYGYAYDRARPEVEKLSAKALEFFGDLVEKGETVETNAQEVVADVRERTVAVYSAGLAKAKSFAPKAAANDRVKELEAEIAELKASAKPKARKAAAKTTKRTTKRKAA